MSYVPPLPSGFRPRIGVRGMLSIAGMTKRGAGGIQAYLRPRNTIFVPKTAWEEGMTQRTAATYCNNNDRTCGRDGNRLFSLQ